MIVQIHIQNQSDLKLMADLLSMLNQKGVEVQLTGQYAMEAAPVYEKKTNASASLARFARSLSIPEVSNLFIPDREERNAR